MWSAAQQWLIWVLFRPLALIFWTLSHVLSWFRGKPPIPPISNQLLMISATELAKMIRSQKVLVQCVSVVEAYIARVKEVNPIVNAVVQHRFEQALQEARDIDMNLKNTSKSEEELERDTPLLGVPVTVKESIPVKGMSNNAGVPGKKRVAAVDAVAVASLRSHGAIPLLVSNTPELCLNWETNNPVTGRTNNPYNPRRTSGGSSGGEGALLGSGASVIGLGSDIGGSGRLPAAFCGVFGHKPTSGYISVEGHMPSSEDPLWPRVFVYAPMARFSEDLPLVMAASIDDKEKLKELRLNEPVDLKNMKFFYMESDASIQSNNINREVKTALEKAISHIKQTYQVPVEKMDIKELRHASQISFVMMMRMSACHSVFQKSEDNLTEWKSVFWQFVLYFLGLCPHALHALIYGAVKRFTDTYSDNEVRELESYNNTIVQELDNYLGDNGVLLYPVFPEPAPLHLLMYYKQLNAPYLSYFNMVGMPATACPVMFSNRGLPIGIQVVAKKGQDRLTMAVAREFEKAFGGWVPPTGSEMTEIKTQKPQQIEK